jgi:hypothetical protein
MICQCPTDEEILTKIREAITKREKGKSLVCVQHQPQSFAAYAKRFAETHAALGDQAGSALTDTSDDVPHPCQ